MTTQPVMKPPVTFDTPRLHLRPMRSDDAAAIFESYGSREDASRYMDFRRHEVLASSMT